MASLAAGGVMGVSLGRMPVAAGANFRLSMNHTHTQFDMVGTGFRF